MAFVVNHGRWEENAISSFEPTKQYWKYWETKIVTATTAAPV